VSVENLGKMKSLPLVFLLAFLIMFSPGLFHPTRGQNDVSTLYVSPLKPLLPPPVQGQSYTVAVNMNISSTDGISGYDIILRANVYNGTGVSKVLDPVSIDPGNVFQGRQTLGLLASCINGSGPSCDPAHGDGSGAVHSSVAVLGDPTPGGQAVTLFYVKYAVSDVGSTELEFTNDNVSYSPIVQNYGPNTIVVRHLDYEAVFSNKGLTAFFNIASPAIPIVGSPVFFDASGSLNIDGSRPITGYRWDFGDTTTDSTGPTVSHIYNRAGSYTATLRVTDGTSWSGIVREVSISSGLGALRIFPVPITGSSQNFQGNITVTLYNLTSSGVLFWGRLDKPPLGHWVLFSGLRAGQYQVNLSGDGVSPMSRQETVVPGWTTWDTLYVPVTLPPLHPDYSLIISLGFVGVGGVAGALVLLRTRRSGKRAKPSKSAVAQA